MAVPPTPSPQDAAADMYATRYLLKCEDKLIEELVSLPDDGNKFNEIKSFLRRAVTSRKAYRVQRVLEIIGANDGYRKQFIDSDLNNILKLVIQIGNKEILDLFFLKEFYYSKLATTTSFVFAKKDDGRFCQIEVAGDAKISCLEFAFSSIIFKSAEYLFNLPNYQWSKEELKSAYRVSKYLTCITDPLATIFKPLLADLAAKVPEELAVDAAPDALEALLHVNQDEAGSAGTDQQAASPHATKPEKPSEEQAEPNVSAADLKDENVLQDEGNPATAAAVAAPANADGVIDWFKITGTDRVEGVKAIRDEHEYETIKSFLLRSVFRNNESGVHESLARIAADVLYRTKFIDENLNLILKIVLNRGNKKILDLFFSREFFIPNPLGDAIPFVFTKNADGKFNTITSAESIELSFPQFAASINASFTVSYLLNSTNYQWSDEELVGVKSEFQRVDQSIAGPADGGGQPPPATKVGMFATQHENISKPLGVFLTILGLLTAPAIFGFALLAVGLEMINPTRVSSDGVGKTPLGHPENTSNSEVAVTCRM